MSSPGNKWPIVKAPRQSDYAVTYYGLGVQPQNDVYGVFIVIGTFDREEDALKAGEEARLKLANYGGTVRVHLVGHLELLLGPQASAKRSKHFVSEQAESISAALTKAERERQQEQERKLRERLTLAATPETNTTPPTLEQLEAQQQLLVSIVKSQETQLVANQQLLAELAAQIQDQRTHSSPSSVP